MKNFVSMMVVAAGFMALAGVAQAGQVIITPSRVPDAGTTSALMGIALAGLAAVRRFVR